MALIAFCAIALVENVTNAQPVGTRGQGAGKTKKTTRQKGWTLVKPTQSTRTATRRHCSQ